MQNLAQTTAIAPSRPLSKDFRRKQYSADMIPYMKRYLMLQINDAFYQENGKASLGANDIKNLKFIFSWLLGEGIEKGLNKGLLFTGDYGTGKSVILKGLIEFINRYYSHDYVTDGIANPKLMLSYEMADHFINGNDFMINVMETTSVLAIDELGYEPVTVRYYGSECKPFEEIIMHRYQRKRSILISTNKTMEEIKSIYGGHVYDRLCQMVYVLNFKGDSKRNK